MKGLLIYFAFVTLCAAQEYPKAKQEPEVIPSKMNQKHGKVMSCFTECMKNMDSLSDGEALECFNKHKICMQAFKFGQPMNKKKSKGKHSRAIVKFKNCFSTLDGCVKDADALGVLLCAADMEKCMKKGKGKKFTLGLPKMIMRLPFYIRNAIQAYYVCTTQSSSVENKATCIRQNIESMKKMSYGMQVSECINKVFICQNKDGSKATDCLNDFMSCKRSLGPKPELQKTDPMSWIADKIFACFNNMEQRHGTVSDEECIGGLSTCILNVNIPMTPPAMVKHGYCFKQLKDCSTPKPTANGVKKCMKEYSVCLGPMTMMGR